MTSTTKQLLAGIAIGAFLTGSAAPDAAAAQASKRMTRVVVVWTANGIPHDPFAERPKTMTRATNQYCRIDLEEDSKRHRLEVAIANEPQMWDVNLLTKTADHFLDPGPTFNCHLPIFGVDAAALGPEIGKLEFGREPEFFTARHARLSVVNGKPTYELRLENRVLRLNEDSQHRPISLQVTYEGKVQNIRYVDWRNDLPFDAGLFVPPPETAVTEGEVVAHWTMLEVINALVDDLTGRLSGRSPAKRIQ